MSVLYFIFIVTLFSFKVNVFYFLRIEDFLSIFLLFFVFFYRKYIPCFSFFIRQRVIFYFLLFVFFSFFSAFYNSVYEKVYFIESFLYVLRVFQYFIYVFLGYLLARLSFNFSKFLSIYVFYIALLIPLQYFEVLPVFSGFTPERAIANTGGPWELAIVASFLVLYFYLHRVYVFTVLSFVVLILTSSRSTLVALFFSFLAGRDFSFYIKFFVYLFLFLSLFLSLFFDLFFISRFLSFFSYDNLSVVEFFYAAQQPVLNSVEYAAYLEGFDLERVLQVYSGSDPSSVVRFNNWFVLLKSLLVDDFSFFVGLGPSFAGKAVDGGFVRLLIETGFFGVIIFLFFIYSVLNIGNSLLRLYMLVIVLTAIFIDSFTTHKAMFLFWVFYGKYLYEKSNCRG